MDEELRKRMRLKEEYGYIGEMEGKDKRRLMG